MTSPAVPDDYNVEIRRAAGGKTFMRIVHVPSGISREVPSIGDEGTGVARKLVAEIQLELARRAVQPDVLAACAYLWDGSEPGWCLGEVHTHECRLVLTFDPPGPGVRDVLAMRRAFEELRDRAPEQLLADVRGKTRVPLERVYGPIDAPAAVERARDAELRVEVQKTDRVSFLPFNEVTKRALIIEDDGLAPAVAYELRSRRAKIVPVEVD